MQVVVFNSIHLGGKNNMIFEKHYCFLFIIHSLVIKLAAYMKIPFTTISTIGGTLSLSGKIYSVLR